MLDMLADENKVVAYYAAFKLSYLPERKAAARALPVPAVDPEEGKGRRTPRPGQDRRHAAGPGAAEGSWPALQKSVAGKMLRIRVLEKRNKQATVSLNIPLALADLAIQSLSDEQKRALQKKGYSLDRDSGPAGRAGFEDRFPG